MRSRNSGVRSRSAQMGNTQVAVGGVRQLRRRGRQVFDALFCSGDGALTAFGKESAWYVHTGLLAHGCVVVSAGVGHDISFEKELRAYYDANILLLDPSPTGVSTMALPENQVPGIRFLPIGLSGVDGDQSFGRPDNEREGSFRVGSDLTLACRSFSSLAREHGWTTVDLLKMDIEGFEYEVLPDVLHSKVLVRQICVEFHHFMRGIPITRTLNAIRELYAAGFRLAHKRGSDYTFVNTAETVK